MNYDQEIFADLMFYVVMAICFGIWQGSYFAGLFMFMLLLEWKAVK